MKVGQWAVVRGSFPHSGELFRVDAITDKQIHNHGKRKRIALRSQLLAVFDDYTDAACAVRRIESIRAEVLRRQIAASEYGDREIAKFVSTHG